MDSPVGDDCFRVQFHAKKLDWFDFMSVHDVQTAQAAVDALLLDEVEGSADMQSSEGHDLRDKLSYHAEDEQQTEGSFRWSKDDLALLTDLDLILAVSIQHLLKYIL
jgi:hypothetical protein